MRHYHHHVKQICFEEITNLLDKEKYAGRTNLDLHNASDLVAQNILI